MHSSCNDAQPRVIDVWFSDPKTAARAIESFRSEEGAMQPSSDYYDWSESDPDHEPGREDSIAAWLETPALRSC